MGPRGSIIALADNARARTHVASADPTRGGGVYVSALHDGADQACDVFRLVDPCGDLCLSSEQGGSLPSSRTSCLIYEAFDHSLWDL
jgi:hypothetical protein